MFIFRNNCQIEGTIQMKRLKQDLSLVVGSRQKQAYHYGL